MAVLASDAFTGTTALSGSWTVNQGTPSCVGGVLKGGTAGSNNGAFYNGVTWPNDQYSQAKIAGGLSANTHYTYVLVRAAGTGGSSNAYEIFTDGSSGATHTEICTLTSGTESTLQSVATTFTTNDVMRLEAEGTTLRAYKNGAQVGTDQTDATYASGSAGLGVYQSTATMDDWEGGSLTSVTLEQEGFRFRNDDGSETTATWVAAQDTGVTFPLDTNLRLRDLINAVGDPASKTFRIDYKLSTDSTYIPVSAHVGSATLSWGAAGGLAFSSVGGGTVAPSYPSGITTKSGLVLAIGMKPSTANSGAVSSITGWTSRISLTGAGGYGATLGNDTGNTNIFVFSKDTVAGTESGTLTVTVTNNDVCWAEIFRVESDVVSTWSFAGDSGSDTSAGNVSITFGSDPGVTAGDFILAGMCIPTDVTTPSQFSAEALTQTGITFGAITEIDEPDSSVGADIGGFNIRCSVSSGTSSAAPVLTATAGGTTTNVRGPGYFLRIRATPYQPLELSASSNITAGGEATTALLTPPSGKTTSDFQTGRMWDDENGTDALDLTADKYTEVEWCIKALAANGASNGQVYNLRITNAGTALDTYTVNPNWTIGPLPVTGRPMMSMVMIGDAF